jgi:hypothetical protein
MAAVAVLSAVCCLLICSVILADAPETRTGTKVQREDGRVVHEAARRVLRERETRRLLLALRQHDDGYLTLVKLNRAMLTRIRDLRARVRKLSDRCRYLESRRYESVQQRSDSLNTQPALEPLGLRDIFHGVDMVEHGDADDSDSQDTGSMDSGFDTDGSANSTEDFAELPPPPIGSGAQVMPVCV